MIIQKKNMNEIKKSEFLVYIIESPSSADFYDKRNEGELLSKVLELASITFAHRFIVDKQAFNNSLRDGLKECLISNNWLTPIIHISSHGDSNGIQFTNGEVLAWDELKKLIEPINKIFGDNLIICMSSCEGFSACKMALNKEDKLPFMCLVGNTGTPVWSETAVAFTTFYHQIARGQCIEKAVNAMRVASGNNEFIEISGGLAKQLYLAETKKLERQEIAGRLAQQFPTPPSVHFAENKDRAIPMTEQIQTEQF